MSHRLKIAAILGSIITILTIIVSLLTNTPIP